MNSLVSFLCWLLTALYIFAALGGLLAWVAAILLFCTERGRNLRYRFCWDEEHRCRQCEKGSYCDAAFTGVAYPCCHFKEKEDRPR
ncbi:hypothetical protein [uncultured Oscillibacter sp.]|uniref:hypothetical protein n=1 Tax=uncultured Oscillibacter sp. TaxID=876091 RepID=UPI0025D285D6|nr:hypothetical protein [uncultured Oscillibacter sp.]